MSNEDLILTQNNLNGNIHENVEHLNAHYSSHALHHPVYGAMSFVESVEHRWEEIAKFAHIIKDMYEEYKDYRHTHNSNDISLILNHFKDISKYVAHYVESFDKHKEDHCANEINFTCLKNGIIEMKNEVVEEVKDIEEKIKHFFNHSSTAKS